MIFIGDALFAGKVGYGTTLQSWLLMNRPADCPLLLNMHGDNLSAQDVFEKIPAQVIGKAPKWVFLGIGAAEVENEPDWDKVRAYLKEIRFLLEDKVRAKTWISNLPTALYQGEPDKLKRCELWNEILKDSFEGNAFCFLDLNSQVELFLENMRESEGEKRSLHRAGPQWTDLGCLLMASYIGPEILEGWEHSV